MSTATSATHAIFLQAWTQQSSALRDCSLHENRWGGHDAILEDGHTVRLIPDDTDFVLYVFDRTQNLLSETRFRYTPEAVMVAALVASVEAVQS